MPIRHAVLFRFTDAATADQIEALAAGLSTMPDETGAVGDDGYQHGRALGLNPGTWDYAVVAEFADANAYEAYRDHPAHQSLIRELVTPITAERASVQFELPG
jgi:hypothetical protein